MVTTKSPLKMQHNWSVVTRSKQILRTNAENLNEMNLWSLTLFFHFSVTTQLWFLFFRVW